MGRRGHKMAVIIFMIAQFMQDWRNIGRVQYFQS